jgi:hypothetical protein
MATSFLYEWARTFAAMLVEPTPPGAATAWWQTPLFEPAAQTARRYSGPSATSKRLNPMETLSGLKLRELWVWFEWIAEKPAG